LGSGNQSVSEHINRVVYVGYVLAMLEGDVDMEKVLKMCMFHDVAEGRVSDLNYVHQKYVHSKEDLAVKDLIKGLPFGEDIKEVIEEYERRESKEAILVKDADNIEWILSLKEQLDTGNSKAADWISSAIKRLKTKAGKEIGERIVETSSDEWWFTDKEGDWWVNRNKDGKK